jgi:hypothetical protein
MTGAGNLSPRDHTTRHARRNRRTGLAVAATVVAAGDAGLVHVELTVTNWAWWDRAYIVPVNVVDPAGERVGSSPDGAFTLTIPARHAVTGRADFSLDRAGGIKCEVGPVQRVAG